MSELSIVVELEPSAADVVRLGRGLTEHALPTTGVPGFVAIAVFARDRSGELRAGIAATVNWNWLQINLVWVATELRGTGLGSRLLGEIEAAGVERGCRHAHLDTFRYQARPFYERHGYEVFAELADYPPGQSRYFMRKRLVGDA
jgi:GNAT superfamily N-acetyltransferase